MNGRWPSLMNMDTAAEYVSLSPRTLEEYLDEGLTPFTWVRLPVGERTVRKRLLAKADLDVWIEEGRRLAQSPDDARMEVLLKQCL